MIVGGLDLLELGDYKGAAAAYKSVLQQVGASTSIATRLGRLAFLNGDTENAEPYLAQSLTLAREEAPTAAEGRRVLPLAARRRGISTGEYLTAERRYRRALAAVADYLPALAALGRVRAARGDLAAGQRRSRRAAGPPPAEQPQRGERSGERCHQKSQLNGLWM